MLSSCGNLLLSGAGSQDEGGAEQKGGTEETGTEHGAEADPGKGDNQKRPSRSDNAGDEAGTEAHDAADEWNDVSQHLQGSHKHSDAADAEQKADQTQNPGHNAVGALRGVKHGVHVLLAHAESREGISVGGAELPERVAGNRGDDGNVVLGNLGERHAHVAHAGLIGRAAEIQHVALAVHHGSRTAGVLGRGIRIAGKEPLLKFRALPFRHIEGEGPFAGNRLNQEPGEAVGAEGDVLRHELLRSCLDADRILMSRGDLEVLGTHGRGNPLSRVGIRSDGFLTASELLPRLGLRLLGPLIKFDLAVQPDGVDLHAKIGVCHLVFCHGASRRVHYLPLKGGVDFVCRGHGNRGKLCLGYGVARADSAPLVPVQKARRHDEEDDAHTDSPEGIPKP